MADAQRRIAAACRAVIVGDAERSDNVVICQRWFRPTGTQIAH